MLGIYHQGYNLKSTLTALKNTMQINCYENQCKTCWRSTVLGWWSAIHNPAEEMHQLGFMGTPLMSDIVKIFSLTIWIKEQRISSSIRTAPRATVPQKLLVSQLASEGQLLTICQLTEGLTFTGAQCFLPRWLTQRAFPLISGKVPQPLLLCQLHCLFLTAGSH